MKLVPNKYIVNKWVFFLIIITLFSILSFLLPIKFLINFSDDDSYYYIKIALNFVKGLGSTFDGVNTTNGYHPLWFLILSGYFKLLLVFGINSPEMIYRFVFLLHFILVTVTLIILWRIVKYITYNNSQIFAFLILIILLSMLLFVRDVAMEEMLFCFLLALFMLVKVKSLYENKFYLFYKLIIIASLCLTRIDSTFSIIYMIVIGDILTWKHKRSFIKNIIYLLFPLLIFLLFGFINYLNFGHFTLISSDYVNSFPRLNILNNLKKLFVPAERFNQLPKLIFFIFIFSYIIFRMIRDGMKKNNFYYFLNYVSIGAFLYIITHLFFNNFGLREWYLDIPMFIISLQFMFILNAKKIIVQKIFLLFFLILFLVVFYVTRIIHLKYNAIYNYSKEIQNYVMPNETVFTFDWMGLIGFFSERKVICGDGFANSYVYQNYLKKKNIDEYLKNYNIDYYSTYMLSEINKNEKFFIDSLRFNLYGLKHIKFPIENLMLTMPYYYDHSTAAVSKGKFYLFKIPKDKL